MGLRSGILNLENTADGRKPTETHRQEGDYRPLGVERGGGEQLKMGTRVLCGVELS